MADNVSVAAANGILNALVNGVSFFGYSATYVKLHVGAPGSAGTANPAGNTVRPAAGSFAAPAAGSTTNAGAINWTSVSTAETYTHCSLWDAASGGNFIASGSITAGAILVGQNFTIPAGGLSVTLPVAS